MAYAFAMGGIDLIKDDHGISDQPFHPFNDRIPAVQEALDKAYLQTGRRTFYFPTICTPLDNIENQVRYAMSHGVKGMLLAPMLLGFDTVRYIAQTYKPVIIAHPAFVGSFFNDKHHGMTPALMLGKMFRLLGGDISIFPNAGGRFSFTKQECSELALALGEPLPPWKKAFPCPAGGMQLENIGAMAQSFGQDTVLLIGGALMQHSKDLTASTKIFMNKIREFFPNEKSVQQKETVSSCEMPNLSKNTLEDVLTCNDFRWTQRAVEAYKPETESNFSHITRQELVGKSGEKTAFDLRYFEIAPGGYSSYEKHVHEHVVIGVRGKGILIKADKEFPIGPHDIGYVKPLEAHQLKNSGTEPFGCYCIVDHQRDKPQKV
jgi:ribulose-bisphosphate carboxylase large chain